MIELFRRSYMAIIGISLQVSVSLTLAGLVESGQFYEKNGVAIDGYDPVAYFEDHRAVKGRPSFSSIYQGSVFHFSSPAHLAVFVEAPERFAPQFGGFCAYGVAEGVKAKSEGEVWEIVAGKLYLNYDSTIQRKWIGGKEVFIRAAEASWPTVQTSTAVHP